MNESRYYTYYLFFSIVLVTFLASISVTSIIYGYYRGGNKKNNKSIYFIFLIMSGFSVTRIIECVILNVKISEMLRSVQASFFIIMIFAISYYIYLEKSKVIKILFFLFCSFLFCSFIFNHKFLLDEYDFNNASYSPIYRNLIFINIVLNIVFVLNILFSSKQVNSKYDNKILTVGICSSLIASLTIYLIVINKGYIYGDFIEIGIYYIFFTFLNLAMYSYGEAGITLRAFDKIGDMSMDYTFVTDGNKNIIYKNKVARDSLFFNKVEQVGSNEIAALFIGELSVKSNRLGKDYLLLKKDKEKYYFTYKEALLMENKKVVGNIITITEITALIELLMELEHKKKNSIKTNSQLKNYSKVVYHIEKEKEINILLGEIINSREEQMKHLAQLISELVGKIDDPLFEEHIDVAIVKSNEILCDVRNTVSTYKEHFGG